MPVTQHEAILVFQVKVDNACEMDPPLGFHDKLHC